MRSNAAPLTLLCAIHLLGQNPPLALPQYEDVTAKSGIDFVQSFGEQKLSSLLESTGSGCAWLDYNNDGLLDLYVLSGRYLEGVTNNSKPDGKNATSPCTVTMAMAHSPTSLRKPGSPARATRLG
jgi:hypothetical protein